MDRLAASGVSVENDPNPTWAGLKSRAQHVQV
jgi:hypothetical protein